MASALVHRWAAYRVVDSMTHPLVGKLNEINFQYLGEPTTVLSAEEYSEEQTRVELAHDGTPIELSNTVWMVRLELEGGDEVEWERETVEQMIQHARKYDT